MNKEYTVKIEQEFITYDPFELEQWRLGNPNLVPQHWLNSKGPGLANGYGYGEFFVERHLEKTGAKVIANAFDIMSKKSKYIENNKCIEAVMGHKNYKRLQDVLNRIIKDGIKVENPDLCVLKPNLFYAEVKKDKDRIRQSQKVFAIVIWEIFRIPFKIYKLLPNGKTYDESPILCREWLSTEYFADPKHLKE